MMTTAPPLRPTGRWIFRGRALPRPGPQWLRAGVYAGLMGLFAISAQAQTTVDLVFSSTTGEATNSGSLVVSNNINNRIYKAAYGELRLSGAISGGNSSSVLFFNTGTPGDGITPFTLSGNNSFRASIRLDRGRLIVSHLNALGNTANEVYLNSNTNLTDGNLIFNLSGTFANPIRNESTWENSISTGTNNVVLGGNIYGSGSLTKLGSGKLTITGSNTYANGTRVLAGTLQVGNGGSAGTLGSGNISISNTGILAFNRTNAYTNANSISGAGSVQQIGTGTTVFSGASTYSGTTTVSNGTLRVSGSIAGSSQIESGGTLDVAGAVGPVTVAAGGRISGNGTISSLTVRSNGAVKITSTTSSWSTGGSLTFDPGSVLDVTGLNLDQSSYVLMQGSSVSGTPILEGSGGFTVANTNQSITLTAIPTTSRGFGSGANLFTIEFVTIGNPGNTADTTGSPNPAGRVNSVYNLGKYEISADMIAKANAAGGLGITYANTGNKPAVSMTWYEAARFVNWLNTSQGYQAAYKFSGSTFQVWSPADSGYQASNPYRNSQARYFLPSADEWYKGAYGSSSGTWYDYPNGSNIAPTATSGGTIAGTAVYSGQTAAANIENAGGLSSYGTMGQGGNVWEWNESAVDGTNDVAGENRILRGGHWSTVAANLAATSFGSIYAPTGEWSDTGFRVASADLTGLDSDGDGLNDALETGTTNFNPSGGEIGSLPNNSDTDGDGINDGVEANTLGSNPNVSQIPGSPVTKQSTATSFVATWSMVEGVSGYEVQVSAEPGFANLIGGTRSVSGDTTTALQVTGLSGQIRYYRVRSVLSSGGTIEKTSWSPAVSAPDLSAFGKFVTLNATGNADSFQATANDSANNASYTVSFWMRPDRLGGVSGSENVQVFRQPINNKTNAANVDIDLLPNGSLVFGQKDEAGQQHFVSAPAKTILARNWYHISAVRDAPNAVLRLYVNGEQIAAKTSAFGTNSWSIVNSGGPGAVQAALNNDANTNRIQAAFDDVRIYRAVRTPSEILQDMGAPLSKAEATAVSSLVFYAPLEGTSLGETDANSFFKGTLNGSGTGTITSQTTFQEPILEWLPTNSLAVLAAPATLSAGLLNAMAMNQAGAPLAGTWFYSPVAGSSLSVGTNQIVGTFVPQDLETWAVVTITNTVVVKNNTAPVASGSATLAAVPKGVQGYVLQGERVGNLFLKNFSDTNDASWATGLFRTEIPWAAPGRTVGEQRNDYAFAALKGDGSLVTWDYWGGGDSSSVSGQISSGVVEVFSTDGAFAALKNDGTVVTWGDSGYGENSSGKDWSGGVVDIFSNKKAFAALKGNGSVVTWGDSGHGGSSSSVSSQLAGGVVKIFSTDRAFAALKSDGSVVTWGASGFGGNSSGKDLTNGVVAIFSTDAAFAALKNDGSVVTWGGSSNGGDSSSVSSDLASGVVTISTTGSAFAALKNDGSVVTWGGSSNGGDSSSVSSDLASGVVKVFSSGQSFAALKTNGAVVTWGDSYWGGNSSSVSNSISSGVVKIFSTWSAFAALKTNGSVVAWGDPWGGGDSSTVTHQLSNGVVDISSTGNAFAALKDNGSVVTWGVDGGDSSGVSNAVSSGVVEIFANPYAFAALKTNGSVVAWGDSNNGGGGSGVTSLLTGGVATLSTPAQKNRLLRGHALTGVAVTANAANSSQGLWQYSTNGFNWSNVPTTGLSDSSALLLDNNAQLRFAPLSNFAGTPGGLTVRLIETGGSLAVTTGTTANVSQNGGTNSVSSGTVVLTTSVTGASGPQLAVGSGLTGTVGAAATYSVTATGEEPITFTATGLPAGLSMLSNGVVSGTPTAAGSGEASVVASNSVGQVTNALSWTINRGNPFLSNISAAPVAAGSLLSDSKITGTAKNSSGVTLSGNLAFQNPSALVSVGTYSYPFVFTPDDSANYNSVGDSVSVSAYSDVLDADEDGFSDWEEISAATNPNASTSFPTSGVSGRVFGWGWVEADDPLQIPSVVRSGVDQVVASPSESFAVAVKGGRAIVWALDNTATNLVATKLAVPDGATSGVVQVAAGYAHVLALRQDGSILVWGDDPGNNGVITGVPSFSDTNFVAVASGDDHCLALRRDGTVLAWGRSVSSDLSPTGQTNFSGVTHVVGIAGGLYHSLALKSDGTLVGRGRTNYGVANVDPGLTGVQAVAAGRDHSLVLLANGTVRAWGRNSSGQSDVPDGTPGGNSILTNVSAMPAAHIAAGRYYSLAVRQDGKVLEWGQYRSDSTNFVDTEFMTPGWLTNVVTATAGRYYSLVIRSDGAAPRLALAQHRINLAPGGQTNLAVTPANATRTFAAVGLPSGITVSSNGILAVSNTVAASNYFARIMVANPNGADARVLEIQVAKQTPTISQAPTASAITFGQSLADSTLTNGVASVEGSFAFTDPSTAPNAGTTNHSVTFTPTDTNNYTTVTTSVSVTVNKASSAITGLAATNTKTFGANPYALEFTRSASTGALSFTSTVAGVATISASGTVTIRGAGQTTLKVSQAADGNYEAAPEVSQVLTVTSLGGAVASGGGVSLSDAGSVAPGTNAPIVNLPGSMRYLEPIELPGAVQAVRVGENNLNLAIPDFIPGGLSRNLTLSGLALGTPYRLTVGLFIQGTGFGAALGDYRVSLRHTDPNNVVTGTRVLLDNLGVATDPLKVGSIANGINAIFADAADANIEDAIDPLSGPLVGTFQPVSLLSGASNGLNTLGGSNWNGTWTLSLIDFVDPSKGEGGTGNLVDWFMQLEDLSSGSATADTSNGLEYQISEDGVTWSSSSNSKGELVGNQLKALSGTGTLYVRARHRAPPTGGTPSGWSEARSIFLQRAFQTITFPALGSRSLSPAFLANASTDSGLNLSYSSSDTNVVTVDSNGLITPVAAGSATITAAQAGDGNFSAATPASQGVTIVATPLTPYFGASQLYWQVGTNPAVAGSRTGHLYEPIKYAEASGVAGIANVQIVGAAAFSLSSTSQPSAGVVGYFEMVSPGMNSGFTSWSGLTNSLKNGNYEFQGKNSSFALVTNATLTWSNSSNFPTAVPRLGGFWVSKALRLADPTTAGVVSWDTWSNRPSNGLIRLELEPEGYSSGGRLSSFLPADTNQFEIPAGFLGTNRIYQLKLSFGVREADGGVHANQTQVRLATGPNYPPSAPVLTNAVAGVIGVREGTNLVGTLELPTDQDSGDSFTPILPSLSGNVSAVDNYRFELTPNAVDASRMDLRLISGNFDYTAKSQYQVLVRHTDGFGLYSETAYTVSVNRPQTITFSPLPTKTYGDSAFDLEATAGSGLSVSYVSSNPNVAEVTGTRVVIKAAGNTTITASQAGGVDGWLAAEPVEQVLTVSPKSLTVGAPTILAREYNGQKTAGSVQVGMLGDFVGSETVTATATAADYPSANVGTYSNVVVTYTLQDGTNGGKASNYRLANGAATGVVTAKELTVGLPVIAPREYDGTKTAGLVQVGPLIGFVSSETVTATAVAADYPSADVGTYSNVVVTYSLANGTNGGLATNYRIPDRMATGIITAKALGSADILLTAPANLVFNNSPKAFTASATGLAGETVLLNLTYESKDGGGNFSPVAGAPSAAGDYRVTATAAGNYGGFKQQEFTITKASSTISVTGTNNFTYNGSPQGPTTASKFGSTAEPTFSYTGVSLTTYPTSTNRPTNAGDYRVVASLAGDGNHEAATPASFDFTIGKATLLVGGITGKNKVYNGNRAADINGVITLSGWVGSDTSSDANHGGAAFVFEFDDANVGEDKKITVSGGGLLGAKAGNYQLGYPADLKANITAKPLTGTFTAENKPYDGNDLATVGGRAVSGKIGEDDVNHMGGTARFDSAAVDDGKTVTLTGATLAGADAGNYSLSSVSTTTANITPVALGIEAPNITKSKVYNGNRAAVVSPGTLSGLISADADEVSVNATAQYDTPTVGTNKTITVSYSLMGSAAGNYTAPGNEQVTDGVITAKGLTITGASAVSRAYDGTTDVVVSGGTLSGLESGDTNSVTLGGSPAGTVDSPNAGTNKVVAVVGYTISGTASSNYSLAQPTDVRVDITKASQTITFNLSTNNVLSTAGTLNLTATATSLLPVSFTSGDTNVATISGSTLTIRGPGTVTITAKQVGDENYEPATDVAQVLTVVDADLPIAVDDEVKAAPIAGNVVKYAVAQLLANDQESATSTNRSTLSITNFSSPTVPGSSLSRKGGWLIYSPSTNAFSTGDSFTYTLFNGSKTATGTVRIMFEMPNFTLGINIESTQVNPNGPGMVITFAVSPGKTFAVEGKTTLSAPWRSLGNKTSETDGRLIVVDPEALPERGFYRVRWIP